MTFTLYLLAAHALGDFPLQSDHMAEHKLDDAVIRGYHVAVYTLVFTPLALYRWPREAAGLFLGLVAIMHFVIDSRRWNENVPIWYDQALHIISLAIAVSVVSV